MVFASPHLLWYHDGTTKATYMKTPMKMVIELESLTLRHKFPQIAEKTAKT
jgi:hypothetical protein